MKVYILKFCNSRILNYFTADKSWAKKIEIKYSKLLKTQLNKFSSEI